MKKLFHFAFFLLSFTAFCQTKQTVKDFNWTVTIPAGYAPGGEDEVVEASTEFLFWYQKDAAHYIEAYSEYFDENVDGSYAEAMLAARQNAVDMANEMMANSTTLAQSETVIGGLPFLTFTTKLVADADFTLNTVTFTRLFKRNSLTVNVYFADPEEGKRLIEAIKQSRFKK